MAQKRKSIRIERGNAQRGCRRIGGEKEADETRRRDRGGEKRLIRSVVRSEMERGAKETETCRRQCVERGEAGADQKKRKKDGRFNSLIARRSERRRAG